MNHINLLLSVFLLTLITTLQGQPTVLTYPDSIRIEFADEKAVVLFEMKEYQRDKEAMKTFPSLLNGLLEHIKKSIPEKDLNSPHRIHVRLAQDGKKEGFVGHERFVPDPSRDRFEITVEKSEKEITQLTVKDNAIIQLLVPGWEIIVNTSRYQVTLYAQNAEALIALTQQSFEPVIQTLDADPGIKHLGKKGIHARLVYQNKTVAFKTIDVLYPLDMIGLHAGAGAGVFRDVVYPELNFSTALFFTNRYRKYTQRIAVSYELKFFTSRIPEGGYETSPNGFLSLSYSRNFAKERPRWTGLGVGYLVNSKGNFFTGKTLKFFFESDIGSPKLNLVPEFYLTDDFKKFAFGVKLGYRF